MTADQAAALLASAGLEIAAGDLEPRGHRWLGRLGDRHVWLADDDAGRRILERERAALAAVELPVAVPEVLETLLDGAADVRRPVPGLVDPAAVRPRILADAALARRIGRQLGRALAALHAIDPPEVARATPSWPESTPWIAERLPRVIGDDPLAGEILAVLDRFDHFEPPARDRALVHTDIGYHNMVFDPETLDLIGLFDFGEIAAADRHWDFCYLVSEGALGEAAIEAYGSASIDPGRLRLYNAVRAFCFLAHRAGHPPDEAWCGRTLAGDLAWCRGALLALDQVGHR